jgi:hypothetical protein
MNVKKNLLSAIFVTCLFLFISGTICAEALSDQTWGYAVDLPEGYALEEKSGTDRYHFGHTMFPVDLQMALYPNEKFEGADKALNFVTTQLKSTGTEVAFKWRFRSAAIGKIETGDYAGWSVAVELADKKGWLVMACFAPEKRATELEALIISTLDGVFTDEGSYFECGPMTAFAWPEEKNITSKFINGPASINVPFDSSDAKANQSVVDREFGLLTAYLNTDLVTPAWQRYYRMIYRDAWDRLVKPTFIAQTTFPKDSGELTSAILSWTQGFEYERDPNGADFTNIPDAFTLRKGDCDSRALLMVIMLNQMGVDAVLLVSPEYSHALAAVDCPGEGARFPVGNKKYLICDTTAKVAKGLIAQDMADQSKWFAVSFYAFY